MIIIQTVSDTKFSLNSITYGKIYQPLAQGDTDISIVNVFDTSQKLVNSTHYTEFQVNGSTFENQDTLISALILVIFSVVSGGGGLWGEIEGTLSDQGDLWSALSGKAPTIHTHTTGQITDLSSYTGFDSRYLQSVDWADIGDKPLTFPPSAHTHTFTSLTSKPTTISGYGIADFNSLGDARWASITGEAFTGNISAPNLSGTNTGDQTLSGLGGVPTSRTLTAGTGLTGGGNLTANRSFALDTGYTDGRYSQLGHTHTFASLTSKPTTIAGYGITDFNSLGDARYVNITGDTMTGNLTAPMFLEGSDRRLKENIEQISKSIYSYTLKADKNKTKRYGTIAQVIEQTNPELVEGEDMKSVTYTNFLCLRIAELENGFDALAKRMDKLENII